VTDIWLPNLWAYAVQVSLLVITGALLILVLKMDAPRVRLACWRGLLGICLLLPLIQPWHPMDGGTVKVTQGPAIAHSGAAAGQAASFDWTQWVLPVLAAGVVLRLGLVGVGFWRLRRYRCGSVAAEHRFVEMQERLGVSADVRVSQDVAGPVTFGLWHPVVLLPAGAGVDEAVACHELLHVRRRDWAWIVAEECVRSVLWFHPAAWWLVARIQLTREEVVDREVVEITRSREQYLEALLAMAAVRAGVFPIPASLFLRRRHLRRRVAALMKEVAMSRLRVSTSTAALAAVVTATVWMGARWFPLQAAPAPQEQTQQKLTREKMVQPKYPVEAKMKGIEGDVVLHISVDDQGDVADAYVVSGPNELRESALQAVRQWKYDKTGAVPASMDVTVTFSLEKPASVAKDKEKPGGPRSGVSGGVPGGVAGGVAGGVKDGVAGGVATEQARTEDSSPPKRIRVGGNVQAANLIYKVTPLYPPEAKEARVQGTVRMNVTVGSDGTVTHVELESGDPLLAPAAMEAVKAWIYRPTLLNGEPVEVVTKVDVNFTLTQ
jgi:TonB family protein